MLGEFFSGKYLTEEVGKSLYLSKNTDVNRPLTPPPRTPPQKRRKKKKY